MKTIFLQFLTALATLAALPMSAQPQPLVINTLAGSANFGSADGIAPAAKFYYPTSVAIDGAGNVYVADILNSTIRKINPSGVVSTVAGMAQVTGTNDGTGSAALLNFPSGVAVDGAGNVFVADSYNNTIREIATNGAVSTVAGLAGLPPSFRDGPASVNPSLGAAFARPLGLAVDTSNNIYIADTYNNLIRKISGGLVTTLAGNLAGGSTDATGTNASFRLPYAIATDGAGNVYVADTGNNLVRRVTPAGAVTTLAGAGGVLFSAPSGIAVDSATNVYLTDTTNQVMRKLTLSGTNWIVSTVAGQLGVSGDTDGGFGIAAFYNPWGVAVDGANTIYVGDSFNGNIRKISAAGVVSTYAGPVGSYGLADGTGNQARFYQANGVAADGSGNVFVADYYNNCIREINAAGTVSTIAGSLTGVIGSADGISNAAQFYYPAGLCLDPATNIYVADSYNSTIRKMTFDGTNWATTTIAGLAENYDYVDDVGTNARFYVPTAVAVDAATNIYVADSFNNAIRVVAPDGTVTTLAGNGNLLNGGYLDGVGTNALFNYPAGVAVDGFSNVFVADAANNVLREISSGAVVTTVTVASNLTFPEGVAVDSGGSVYIANSSGETILGITPGGKRLTSIAGANLAVGSADGFNTAARFDTPVGIAVDVAGNVYVADTVNNTIRKGIAAGAQSAVVALDTSPSGFPVLANGATVGTPQFLVLTLGSTNTVSATSPSNFVFLNWTQNGAVASTANDYTFAASSNTTIVANYLPIYSVTVSASPPAGGAVSGGKSSVAGSSVTVTATPASGFAFGNWTLNGTVVNTSNSYTFVLAGNVALVANFLPLSNISLSPSPTNGGTVSGAGAFVTGTTNTVTAVANNGFVLTNWTLGGVVVSTSSNYSFVLATNVNLVANFARLMTVLTWANPTAITYGTPLGANQLKASANVPGTFAYAPTTGSILPVGTNLLSVTFTPADTVNYTNSSTTASVVVLPAPLTVTAANATWAYGKTNPPLTGTITGPVSGDNISANYNSPGTNAAVLGTYLITPSLVDPSNRLTNYSVTLINGALTLDAAPYATSLPATFRATLNGAVTPNFAATAAWFQWGTNTNYGSQTTVTNIGSSTNASFVSAALSGLTGLGQVYHFRIVASNSAGVTLGTDQRFVAGGKVKAWGDDAFGQTDVPLDATNAVAVAGGGSHSLALTASGTVEGWGDDYYGQLDVPVSLTNPAAIAAGYDFSVALTTNGSVVPWGDDAPGAPSNSIAIAAEDSRTLALSTNGTLAGLGNIVAIAADGSHDLALKNDGSVVALGSNLHGEGNVPTGLSNVVAISAGLYHSVALQGNGAVVAWGDNTYGQLNVPASATNIVAISAGRFHTVALRADGSVIAWGDNSLGQTNIPPGLSNVAAVAAGAFHNLALVADQTVNMLPVVVTLPVSLVSATNAVLNGSVIPGSMSTTVRFQWGRTTNYGNSTGNLIFDSGTSPVAFSNVAVNLAPLATYHFRAVATNVLGLFVGGDVSFSTPVPPYRIGSFGFTASNNFHLTFTGTPNATYELWASTNLSNWIDVGPATEDLPGQFEANDSSAANNGARFYELRWH